MGGFTVKLMFISDIHGSETCLAKALLCYEEEKPDRLVILGDILYHGPRNPLPEGYNPKGVIELINPLKESIMAVRGNCDSEVDQMVIDFPMMGDYHLISIEGVEFFLTHGHMYNNQPSELCRKGSVFAQGHTHVPMIKQKGDVLHFNPGSITLPKENHPQTYGIYEHGVMSIKTLDGKTYKSAQI